MKKDIFDITIIGAGPVGLFTGFYAGLRQAKFKIIDSLEKVGGQPRYLYPEKNIYDIPAFEAIKGDQLANNLLHQLDRFDYDLCLGQEISQINRQEDLYQLISLNGDMHWTRSIILAVGNGAFNPKKLSLEGAEDFEGHNLNYYVQPINYYHNREVVILGGGDSAVDWALELEKVAQKVTLIHRRDKFRAMESSVNKLKASSVEIITPYVPESLIGQNGRLEQLVIKEARGNQTRQIPLDELIVNYGFSSSMGSIRHWGMDIERNSICVNADLETSRPGIFAVGDIATYPGKVKLIVTGFGEAPQAVNNALLYINPANVQPPLHSSDLL